MDKLNLTEGQLHIMRLAHRAWDCYATDPYRHDNIDIDENYQQNCNDQDDHVISEYINPIIKQFPELAGKEEQLIDWFHSY